MAIKVMGLAASGIYHQMTRATWQGNNPAEVLQNFASREFRFRFADPKYGDLMLDAIRERDDSL